MGVNGPGPAPARLAFLLLLWPLLAASGCRTPLSTPAYATGRGSPDLGDGLVECGTHTVRTTEVVRADLLIIQDRSSSMRLAIDGMRDPPPGQSRWEQVRDAIKQVVKGTTGVDWGLMLYAVEGMPCTAPITPDVPVAPNNAPLISALLDAATPHSDTPTTAAIDNAVAWFRTVHDGRPHYLLLATDGQPTCGAAGVDSGERAIEAVTRAAQSGVRTFVVGIGKTGADEALSEMAIRGGAPNPEPGGPPYFRVTSSQELVDVLEAAALRVTRCSYALDPRPPEPDHVVIASANGVMPRDSTHENGWDSLDGGSTITFFGEACEALRSGVTTIEVRYYCHRP